MNKENPITELLKTIHQLRAPGGCPWDRKQTHHSLRPYVIEEAYEVAEILEKMRDTLLPPSVNTDPLNLKLKDDLKERLKEELGDLLLQVLLHSEIASEQADGSKSFFNFYDVAQGLNEKIIRRHPHVFSSSFQKKDQPQNEQEVVQLWDQIKKKEVSQKGEPTPSPGPKSILKELPKDFPALEQANHTIQKVSEVGFQWNSLEGPLQKLEEELHELKEAIFSSQKEKQKGSDGSKRIEEELGDLLFSVCNVAFHLGVNPEHALRQFLNKFKRRFFYIEKTLFEKGRSIQESHLEEMDALWNEAKKSESSIK